MTIATSHIPASLLTGYQQFRAEVYAPRAKEFHALKQGQNPEIMVIGCADSRVDPSVIFSAEPGSLFTLRNIAALVPPYERGGGLHGVSSAIEFAVKSLGVTHIVVLGHGLCGGVAACIASHSQPLEGEFVPRWVELAAPARDVVMREYPDATQADLQRLCEYHTISLSLTNLETFPFIKERLDAGMLQLHGAWYSVYQGSLRWRHPQSGQFEAVEDLS